MKISDSQDITVDFAEVLGALAHPLRVQIMRTLMHHPMCVSRLAAALDAPQPSVSRALTILRQAGLVARHRCGAFVRYGLTETLAGRSLAPLHEFIKTFVPDVYDKEATDRLLAARGIHPPPVSDE